MAAYCSAPVVLTLTLGTTVLDLMDQANGFRVSEVDLSYPDVREDVDMAADRHGTLDFTRLFGARAVTIVGSLVPSAAGSRSKALHALAPFLDPSARPTLTYQIDADVIPKTLTLRATDLTVPFTNPTVSDWSVGWKCPDPFAYDAQIQTAMAWASATGGGRQYNLVFPRVYPPGGTSSATATNNGDFPVYPTIRLYGPVTGPQINFVVTPPGGAGVAGQLAFQTNYVVSAGNYLEIDCRRRTIFLNGDRTNSQYGQLIFLGQTNQWPYIPAGGHTQFLLAGTNTSNVTQLQAQWQDAYLL